jgi:hypothetical protein
MGGIAPPSSAASRLCRMATAAQDRKSRPGREFPGGFFYGESRNVTVQVGAAFQVSTLKVSSPATLPESSFPNTKIFGRVSKMMIASV